MKQIFNVPEGASDGFAATFSVQVAFTKVKAKRKVEYLINQTSIDEIKGNITEEVEPFWARLLETCILKNPYGERSFAQGALHARTSAEDGVLYVVVYKQDKLFG